MTTKAHAREEAQIREAIDAWTKAVQAKDADAVMASCAPDIRTFDLQPPLEHVGADLNRRNWAEWFDTFRGPVGYEVRDLTITAGDDVAFSDSLNRLSGTRTDGSETDVWVRATVGYQKIDGNWTVVHQHVSVPFYMDGSFKAAVDLEP